MIKFDNLNFYNGDTEHDMWVDFDNYENTGEPDVFFAEQSDKSITPDKDFYRSLCPLLQIGLIL